MDKVTHKNKIIGSIDEIIDLVKLKDGMTVSFHHHFRNGDKVVNFVMEAISKRGIKDIHLAASGIFPCHAPLVKLIEDGVITSITTSVFNPGRVADAISEGKLKNPAILMTHGGRARSIESGHTHIDVAFIAAPTSDNRGNSNGTEGPNACGFLSYAYADAEKADYVVVITDNLVPYPAFPIEIRENNVDYVLKIESIGNPEGIVSGSTKITSDPIKLKIAADAAKLIYQLDFIKDGFSFQTGASSTSLAVAENVKTFMAEKKVKGSFALGGIHAYLVQMLEEGYFSNLLDTQCFDLEAIRSARTNTTHVGISASQYANPDAKSCVVNNLDVVILGATEIDTNFNVNVVTASSGMIMGASGGHSDCAAGAKLAIVVTTLMKKNTCAIKDNVLTVTTPGETIDAVVTEYGIAINPRRQDLLNKIGNTDLKIVDISWLRKVGKSLENSGASPKLTDKIVGFVEYRDGTVIDTIKQVIR